MWKKTKSGFPGGVHPTDGSDKALTMDLPIRVYRPETAEKVRNSAYSEKLVSLDSITREEIVDAMEKGGLVGMGGAGFPTHIKYRSTKKIDVLLVNGAECEPFLTCDYRLMLEYTKELVNGVRLLLLASGADRAVICIEDNKPKAAEEIQKTLKGSEDSGRIEVKLLPTKYPQGGERQLIQSVIGKEVPMGGLPADVGVIVSNVGTAKAAADMILGGVPLTRRIVTVTGLVKEPGNYLVPIGTTAKELLEFCGGVTEKHNRIIAGGPMTGPCKADSWDGESDLFTIEKNTSGILVLKDFETEEQPCIRCGACENACPAGLTPFKIDFAYLEEDYDLCESLYAGECIACGCCSYVCPADRELTLRTRMARDMVKQRMRERTAKKS